MIRAAVKAVTPPIILSVARRLRASGPGPAAPPPPGMALEGPFASWADAAAKARGYEDDELVGRVLERNLAEAATLAVGDYILTDRDQQIASAVLTVMQLVGRPDIVVDDLGGEMGGFYRVLRHILGPDHPLKWRVIETAPMVAAAREHFTDPNLTFIRVGPEWIAGDRDLVIASGVLQTLPNPIEVYRAIFASCAPYAVITTSPFADTVKDVVTLRVVRGGEESYPLWTFSSSLWGTRLAKDYEIVSEWRVAKSDKLPDGRPITFPGYLLRRRQGRKRTGHPTG